MELHFYIKGRLLDQWSNYPYVPQLQAKVKIGTHSYTVVCVTYSETVVIVELE